MNYFYRIQEAIEYIENNLKEEVSITDIASKAFFSSFHFQRLFQAISGFSVHEYIRKRRMSEAAILLKETDKTILDIAIEFQYGSQEAFTRAFENCFNLTPAKYRKMHEFSVNHLLKMNFLDYAQDLQGMLMIDKPDIIQLEKIYIIGHEYKTNLYGKQYFGEIPGFYDHFGENEYYMKIPDRIAPGFPYGIACNYCDDGQFSFIVGEAVKLSCKALQSNLINFEIPEGKYVVFKVNAPLEDLQNTWRYIYGTWMPNSNYERRDGPDFEVIDLLTSIFPEKVSLKIYIPVK